MPEGKNVVVRLVLPFRELILQERKGDDIELSQAKLICSVSNFDLIVADLDFH